MKLSLIFLTLLACFHPVFGNSDDEPSDNDMQMEIAYLNQQIPQEILSPLIPLPARPLAPPSSMLRQLTNS